MHVFITNSAHIYIQQVSTKQRLSRIGGWLLIMKVIKLFFIGWHTASLFLLYCYAAIQIVFLPRMVFGQYLQYEALCFKVIHLHSRILLY